MSSLRRRRFLQAGGAVVVAALTGCTAATDQPGTTSSPRTTEPTGDAPSPPEWTPTTDCGGEYDGMHESVVRVEQLTASLDSGTTSIQFSALSAGEQSIFQSVTEDGGYATCDTSDAFDRSSTASSNTGTTSPGTITSISNERRRTTSCTSKR